MSSESLYRSCPNCDKQVAAKAWRCPHCRYFIRKRDALFIIIPLAIVMLVLSNGGTPQSDKDSASQAEAHPVSVPASEQAFVSVVKNYIGLYDQAKNDLQRDALKRSRASDLTQSLADLHVSHWIGKVSRLETTNDGQAVFAVNVSPNIKIETWNNSFSDISDHTLIDSNSRLYHALFNLSPGETVRFSGTFIPDPSSYIKEVSLTTEGSLTEPEYLFHFNSVTTQTGQ